MEKTVLGKSTLARLIAGITKPTSGSICVDELEVKEKKNFLEIRKKVGIVFQNPENQILFTNVTDDMSFALKNLKLEDTQKRIKKALQQVGMEKYETADTYELSLGQKQRITIASVLAVDTKYLVLDEPTTMLDPMGKEAIYNIIKNLKKQGYTIIYITNIIDEILLADRIVIMEQGRVVHSFPKEEIMQHLEQIEQCGIKIPTLVSTLKELQANGIDITLTQWTMDELVKEIIRIGKK